MRQKQLRYTKELLEPIVKESVSYSEVCRKLNRKPAGAMWESIKGRIIYFEIDTSHFLGKASHTGFRHTGRAKKRTPEEILVSGKIRRESGKSLRTALIATGREYRCEKCGIDNKWCDEPITLQVDHIDWNWSNCVKENLQILCPNCHSQRRKATLAKLVKALD